MKYSFLFKIIILLFFSFLLGNAQAQSWYTTAGNIYLSPYDTQVGIGTAYPVSWAELDIRDSNGDAYIRLMGTGDGNNFSGINLSSNESTDKQWEIIHRESPLNSLLISHNNGSSWKSALLIESSGNIGIGTLSPNSILDVRGTTTTEILEITGGSDLAEYFQINKNDTQLLPGMVVSIDPNNPGGLKLSENVYDKKVAGIISGANNLKTGLTLKQNKTIANGEFPVALTGRVYCYVESLKEEIKPGDLLTTSNIPGYAMKVVNHKKAKGSIIGKAMTGLEKGKKGFVLVLISLQ